LQAAAGGITQQCSVFMPGNTEKYALAEFSGNYFGSPQRRVRPHFLSSGNMHNSIFPKLLSSILRHPCLAPWLFDLQVWHPGIAVYNPHAPRLASMYFAENREIRAFPSATPRDELL
jgi:hypothetical protein